jgi:hypothetical protein
LQTYSGGNGPLEAGDDGTARPVTVDVGGYSGSPPALRSHQEDLPQGPRPLPRLQLWRAGVEDGE